MILLSAMAYGRRGTATALTVTLLLAACVSAPIDQIELMPAPDVYGEGLLNPLPEQNPQVSKLHLFLLGPKPRGPLASTALVLTVFAGMR